MGIIRFDGAPVDRALLRQMTERLVFRGPDAINVHIDGAVGHGHTLLRTTPEPRQEM